MNVDDDRNNVTQHTVTSKYFTKNEMDESLTDFKQTKKRVIGPKSTKTCNKAKPKKNLKRIRGQKDIRSALKTKKSDLEKYTEEFKDICTKSGIDVDAEELQVIIALSKSLEPNHELESPTKPKLNVQERKSKIRATLQEYGFKIPENKIANKTKVKKYRKQYKLLTVTDVERQQIVSDKYSQVLLQYFDVCSIFTTEKEPTPLYIIATNTMYNDIKDNSPYYVNDLIERSKTNGCLLKDYASIPGRPVSPKLFEESKIDFSEIECSQDELDVVLSGTIKSAKNVLKSKQNKLNTNMVISIDNNIHKSRETTQEIPMNIESSNYVMCEENKDYQNYEIKGGVINKENNELNSIKELLTVTPTKQYRSCSPDIFDEEISYDNLNGDMKMNHSQNNRSHNYNASETENIDEGHHISLKHVETTSKIIDLECFELNGNSKKISDKFDDKNTIPMVKESMQLTQLGEITKRKSNDFMDLTECIQTNQAFTVQKFAIQISEGENTKRKSNDFMEITDCVSNKLNFVDMTSNKFEKDKDLNDKTIENIDLTQSSNSNEGSDELPIVCLNESHSLDKTVILNEKEYSVPNKIIEGNNLVFDLSDENIHSENKDRTFDDFVHDHSEESKDSVDTEPNIHLIETTASSSELIDVNSKSFTQNTEFEHAVRSDKLNLPQSAIRSVKIDLTESINQYEKSPTYSDNERYDIDLQLSDSIDKQNINIKANKKQSFVPKKDDLSNTDEEENEVKIRDDNVDIDLTQDTNEYYSHSKLITSPRISSLGKRDNISIDYDEIYNKTPPTVGSMSNHECVVVHNDMESDFVFDHDYQPIVYDDIDTNTNIENNYSQGSDVFEISDKELDYSLNKSRHKNFDIGGLSIIDNISKIDTSSIERVKDNSMMEIKLLKNSKTNIEISPKITSNIKANCKTPGNSEYIIRTDEVTPMLNYAALSSPERNRELDKYGIKSLKRKRAIQLLTHIYNQTHPMIESCSEDLPSPSKRLCTSTTQLKPRRLNPTDTIPQTNLDYENISELSNNREKQAFTSSQKSNSPKKKSSSHTPRNEFNSPRKISNSQSQRRAAEGEEIKENLYQVTNETPCIKTILCEDDDLVFQKREKAKLHSCRLPLHIAFHNYVSSRNGLREAILRYEPVNIDVIHKELVSSGHRYDPKDLLKFMDKKCITVKTSDNNSRNDR